MRFARIRSGLVESVHDVSVIAIDRTGTTLYATGDTDRPMFHRSAIKPFQALAAMRLGLELPPEHLAVTCSSHRGFPVQVAIVERILSDHGLGPDALQCPPDWPWAQRARDIVLRSGATGPERRFHNCSGKHAGWLAACNVAGLPTESYLDPGHRIQRDILGIVTDLTGEDPEPVGVDGCGAPTLRGTVHGLARAFSRLTSDPELAAIAGAMSQYPALVADNVGCEGRFGISSGGPSKGGAEGAFATSLHGIGIAAKSAEGSSAIAVAAAIEVARRIGLLPRTAAEQLDDCVRIPVIGASRQVGSLELVEA
ncbi:MAG TPA: asparaginase [Acidimicrobiia bacterium]|nr:asparaginase [Acidimicrobiia bacterium]